MRKKVIKPNQHELENIANAEREIKEVCEKYNVQIVGGYWSWSDYGDSYAYTDQTFVRSLDYIDREERYHEAREVWAKYKQQQSDLRFANKIKVLYPNHRGLNLFVKQWKRPNSKWYSNDLVISGLKVRDWSKVRSPLFDWNPNGFWQYRVPELSDVRIRAELSIYVHPSVDTPTIFSHPGSLKFGIYNDNPCGQDKYSIVAMASLIASVDYLIELGVLEIENQVNP